MSRVRIPSPAPTTPSEPPSCPLPLRAAGSSFGHAAPHGRVPNLPVGHRSTVTVRLMERYELAEAAARAGISPDELRRLVELGIIGPDTDDRFTPGDVRRVGLVESLVAAGIPLDGLGAAIRSGQVSLYFLDAPVFERFSALSGVTFAQLSERTGVPAELLMLIREAAGSNEAHRPG
jgi:DNA-binding transcriptional MerR regulator